ncbi:MAG TPA: diacylglycerol kinase family protein [Actinomycetota bacterium]|jgi:YegS/Rv2252/BmrU family lipid kinase
MRRCLLIANANAQTVTRYGRGVIARALSAEFNVTLAETQGPGHATEMARDAADGGVDLVVALGGDGTVNEAVNGLALTDTPLAILPGGGANVFARALGIPRDPVEAAGALLERIDDKPRRVSLGRVDGRYFVVNCGVGLDAAIVQRVERRQFAKRAAGDLAFLWAGLRTFFIGYGRREPKLELHWGDDLEHQAAGMFLILVQNTEPFTYLGERALNFTPGASLDEGLDFLALDTLRIPTVLRIAVQSFGSGRHVRNAHVTHVRNQHRIVVEAATPMPVQADGEFVGERERVEIVSVPEALSLLV